MNLPNGTLLINPSLEGDTDVFHVYTLRVETPGDHKLYHLLTFGTIGEALAYIEGCCEERVHSTSHRDLTDHDTPEGS